MVVAIPLKASNDYTELRFCLRSIDKFVQPDEVLIIGSDLPDWCVNVTWLQMPDVTNRKQLTIKVKIMAALHYAEQINEPGVLWFHDDVFALKLYEPVDYWAGSLRNVGESGAKPLLTALQAQGKAILNYDCHTPIWYDKAKFGAVLQFHSDCIIKSAYCNWWEVGGIETTDCKIHSKYQDVRRFIDGRPYLSTSNSSIGWCVDELNRRFPIPCRYEI